MLFFTYFARCDFSASNDICGNQLRLNLILKSLFAFLVLLVIFYNCSTWNNVGRKQRCSDISVKSMLFFYLVCVFYIYLWKIRCFLLSLRVLIVLRGTMFVMINHALNLTTRSLFAGFWLC